MRLCLPYLGDELGETYPGKRVKKRRKQEEKDDMEMQDAPISLVLNEYTPTRTPTVSDLNVQVEMGARMGNLRLCM